MTKREKLRILKEMKKILLKNGPFNYLCFAWSIYKYGVTQYFWKAPLEELGIEKPIGAEDFWWPPDDYTSRLRALNAAIKKLQPKKK